MPHSLARAARVSKIRPSRGSAERVTSGLPLWPVTEHSEDDEVCSPRPLSRRSAAGASRGCARRRGAGRRPASLRRDSARRQSSSERSTTRAVTRTLSPWLVDAIALMTQTMPPLEASTTSGGRSGRSMKWSGRPAGPGRRGRRARRGSPRDPRPARGGSCRRRSRNISVGSGLPSASRVIVSREDTEVAQHVGEAVDREPVLRRDVPTAAELGRDHDLPLPLRLADEQPRAGDVDVHEAVGVPGEHAADHPAALLRVVDPVHLRPGHAERGRPPLCMSTTMSARGNRSVERKWASCSSTGPSGRPGNERLKFAPDGHSRVYAREASGETHGITISRPVTSSGRRSRARFSAATWPSGSSPWTPPSTSTVGPSPPRDRDDRDEEVRPAARVR